MNPQSFDPSTSQFVPLTAGLRAGFSATVRDEVDLDKLTEALLAAVEETMQPAHVSLWLSEIPARGRDVPSGSEEGGLPLDSSRHTKVTGWVSPLPASR